jgi:hypothetical protein
MSCKTVSVFKSREVCWLFNDAAFAAYSTTISGHDSEGMWKEVIVAYFRCYLCIGWRNLRQRLTSASVSESKFELGTKGKYDQYESTSDRWLIIRDLVSRLAEMKLDWKPVTFFASWKACMQPDRQLAALPEPWQPVDARESCSARLCGMYGNGPRPGFEPSTDYSRFVPCTNETNNIQPPGGGGHVHTEKNGSISSECIWEPALNFKPKMILISYPGQSTWDVWWTEWYWERFCFESAGFTPPLSFPCLTTFTHVKSAGWTIAPLAPALP